MATLGSMELKGAVSLEVELFGIVGREKLEGLVQDICMAGEGE